MKSGTGILLYLCFFSLCFGQSPPTSPYKVYVDSSDRYYQQAELPLYVFISDKPGGKFYQLKPEKNNRSSDSEAFYPKTHGKHLLQHYDTEHEEYAEFEFYVDGKPPVSQHMTPGVSVATNNNRTFYGKNLMLCLSSQDDLTGTRNLFYSINNEDFKPYKKPLKIDSEGRVFLQYYATDKVGNMEKLHQEQFIVDLSPPTSRHQIVGLSKEDIIAPATRLFLDATDSLSGIQQTRYRLDGGEWEPYSGNGINVSTLSEGNHTLSYFSVDQVDNAEKTQEFTFFLDKSAPIVSPDVLGDKFLFGDIIYFSGRSKLKLIALDNKSGVREVKYSINEKEFISYDEPFYLPSESGIHHIRYYAVDEMDNEGVGGTSFERFGELSHKVDRIYVDLNGPILDHEYLGPHFLKVDTMYIHPQTKIKLTGTDDESGLNYLAYSLDKSTDEKRFEEPFNVAEAGHHKLTYYGYDNVNNRNFSSLSFVVDDLGPQIIETFSIVEKGMENGRQVFPAYTTLYLSAVDSGTGTKDIFYSINGSALSEYTHPIQGFVKNQNYEIAITAYDLLGNKTEKTVQFRTGNF